MRLVLKEHVRLSSIICPSRQSGNRFLCYHNVEYYSFAIAWHELIFEVKPALKFNYYWWPYAVVDLLVVRLKIVSKIQSSFEEDRHHDDIRKIPCHLLYCSAGVFGTALGWMTVLMNEL